MLLGGAACGTDERAVLLAGADCPAMGPSLQQGLCLDCARDRFSGRCVLAAHMACSEKAENDGGRLVEDVGNVFKG